MSLDPEFFEDLPVPEQPEPVTYPRFEIDEDASEEQKALLQNHYEIMLRRPAVNLNALHRFMRGPDEARDKRWLELTDTKLTKVFWFDDETEDAIAADISLQHLRKQGSAETGQRIRSRRLEIFLERTIAVRRLGRIGLK